jgi:peptidoglycan/xylan/chitin deacetylase (PgdA/CDA1 family)
MAFACLMYHSLSDGRYPDRLYPKYTTTQAHFAEHLRMLRGEGFTFGSFADLEQRLASGNALPDRYCVLTFDDGHKSSLDLAEEMKRQETSATFFLTANYCRERDDFLKPDEIRGMAGEGFDFGAHGVTHRALGHLPLDAMRDELRESKAWVEEVLGKPITSMSLPAGQSSPAVLEAAFALGYRLVGNSREDTNSALHLPSAVNRFVVLASYEAAQVRQLAVGSPAYIWKRRLRSALIYLPKRILRTFDVTRS